jgi:hypothetical protein
MQTEFSAPKIDLRQTALFLCGVAALAGIWFVLWMWFLLMTEGWLVPWDTTSIRPPVGSLVRTINDFFEVAPGGYLPATLFVLADASIFVWRFRRVGNRMLLPFFFAISNLAFGVLATVLAILSHQLPNLWLPQPRPEFDAGFHLTWPAIASTAILVTILFTVQLKWSLSFRPGKFFAK